MAVNDTVRFEDVGAVDLVERPVPEPDDDEVKIATERTLVSVGSELAMLSGTHQPDNLPGGGLPLSPGYSNIGRIEAVGADVDDSRIGQRVASLTEHARFVTAKADDCVPVPDEVSSVTASFFRIGQIAMNALRRGQVTWGQPVAVRGLGIVGQLAARTAVVAGAMPVYAIDLAADRVASLPADDRLRPVHLEDGGGSPGEEIVDVVIDATGNPDTLGAGVSLLREDGRFVVVGCPRRTVPFDFYRDCIVPSAHIIGSYRLGVGEPGWDARGYADLFFDYVMSGDIDPEPLVTAEPSPEEAPAVYEALLEDRTAELGVVFDWT